MRTIFVLFILSTFGLSSYGQKYKYPGPLDIYSYQIGDKIDTTLFKKYDHLYFPNYLDGWTMTNIHQLPDKYKGLPIAMWISKKDSSVILTLLNDMILNITVSYLTKTEQDQLSNMATLKFGGDGKKKSYKERHPFQAYITYWNLKTWETKDVVLQIGNSDMRLPKDPVPKDISWNLVYSDFLLEDQIISDFRKK